MPHQYYSEREFGVRPKVNQDVTIEAWHGIISLIRSNIDKGSFGIDFPELCQDRVNATVGTNAFMFENAANGDVPEIEWPLLPGSPPSSSAIFDLLEFCYTHIAEIADTSMHEYYGHQHLSYDRALGQSKWCQSVNQIFARNGMAYEFKNNGCVQRIGAPMLHELLTNYTFCTGDAKVDELLELARSKFLTPDTSERNIALEKLFDAWERIKTLAEEDKRRSLNSILDRTAHEPNFRKLIDDEARTLTGIGNSYHIRHFETNKVPIHNLNHIDYLFYRMFALIWLILCARQSSI